VTAANGYMSHVNEHTSLAKRRVSVVNRCVSLAVRLPGFTNAHASSPGRSARPIRLTGESDRPMPELYELVAAFRGLARASTQTHVLVEQTHRRVAAEDACADEVRARFHSMHARVRSMHARVRSTRVPVREIRVPLSDTHAREQQTRAPVAQARCPVAQTRACARMTHARMRQGRSVAGRNRAGPTEALLRARIASR
jgi:hypothetical protein